MEIGFFVEPNTVFCRNGALHCRYWLVHNLVDLLGEFGAIVLFADNKVHISVGDMAKGIDAQDPF